MQDRRMQRIQRQLGSVVVVLQAAANEAESLTSQNLAEDLHRQLAELREIQGRIGDRGQTYRRARSFQRTRA